MNTSEFHVVVNHEGQFSIWPTFKSVPNGWSIVGEPASRDHCLKIIDKVWTDMRPKSRREKIAQ
jgi:MbtH protein